MNPSRSTTTNNAHKEARRRPRRTVSGTVEVIDSMTDRIMGHLGNISETGMLLLANTPLVDDALFQVRFNLAGNEPQRRLIEVGVHLLWQERASAIGKAWAGFRFINLPEPGRQHLHDWLTRAS